MHESLRQPERVGIENEFDQLWSPVYQLHNSIYNFTREHKIRWGLDPSRVPKPGITVSEDIPENVGELTDEQIFDAMVDAKTPDTIRDIALFARYVSLLAGLESSVKEVNRFLNFDVDNGRGAVAFSDIGRDLFLHGVGLHGLYGFMSSERRSVRLFGFAKDGTQVFVKRFGDEGDNGMEVFSYNQFCAGLIPDYRPTLDAGDFEVIPKAEILDEGQFS